MKREKIMNLLLSVPLPAVEASGNCFACESIAPTLAKRNYIAPLSNIIPISDIDIISESTTANQGEWISKIKEIK